MMCWCGDFLPFFKQNVKSHACWRMWSDCTAKKGYPSPKQKRGLRDTSLGRIDWWVTRESIRRNKRSTNCEPWSGRSDSNGYGPWTGGWSQWSACWILADFQTCPWQIVANYLKCSWTSGWVTSSKSQRTDTPWDDHHSTNLEIYLWTFLAPRLPNFLDR